MSVSAAAAQSAAAAAADPGWLVVVLQSLLGRPSGQLSLDPTRALCCCCHSAAAAWSACWNIVEGGNGGRQYWALLVKPEAAYA
jgi:hypothetical protein